jgi:hypothetical protein
MKNAGAVVIACLLACTSVCYSQTSNISDQPSFGRRRARQVRSALEGRVAI